MAKRGRKRSKRTQPAPRQRRSVGRSSVTGAHINVPSAASLFRFCFVDPESSGLIDRTTAWLKPFIGTRDKDAVTRIKRAKSAEEVIELVPLATGLGEPAWRERVRQFGLEAVPLISQRLAVLHETREEELRHMMLEKLIGALRCAGKVTLGPGCSWNALMVSTTMVGAWLVWSWAYWASDRLLTSCGISINGSYTTAERVTLSVHCGGSSISGMSRSERHWQTC